MTACDHVSPFDSAQGDTCENLEILQEEWIELFNPTDHEILLGGWILDDLKDGGSKPYILPENFSIEAGEYLIFSKNETKLQLNDAGDDAWFIAPGDGWSDHVTIPKLKAGISFSFCEGEWLATAPTPGLPNDCQTTEQSSISSVARSTKSPVASGGSFLRTRYVPASRSSLSSFSSPSSLFSASGSFLMSYALSELPDTLTVAGPVAEKSAVPEVGALGALSGLGVVLIFLGRKWWFL